MYITERAGSRIVEILIDKLSGCESDYIQLKDDYKKLKESYESLLKIQRDYNHDLPAMNKENQELKRQLAEQNNTIYRLNERLEEVLDTCSDLTEDLNKCGEKIKNYRNCFKQSQKDLRTLVQFIVEDPDIIPKQVADIVESYREDREEH